MGRPRCAIARHRLLLQARLTRVIFLAASRMAALASSLSYGHARVSPTLLQLRGSREYEAAVDHAVPN